MFAIIALIISILVLVFVFAACKVSRDAENMNEKYFSEKNTEK